MSQTTPNGATPAVPTETFRRAMRRWTTGVAVVTVRAEGEARGVTVNSFTSVSLDPPLVLICLDRRARTHQLILTAGHFCVNVLDERQQELSDRYAGRRPGEQGTFDDCSRARTPAGAPLLDGAVAWLDCRVVACHAAGDHDIIIGQVLAAQPGDDDGNPLLFAAGRYSRLPAAMGSRP